MLTLKAFGALDFRDDACESVAALLAQPKRAALLAYLILAHPGTLCRRDTLLALFWPDLDQEAGRHALSQALSYMRRHLAEGTLVTRGSEEVGVDAARTRSDVQAFRNALEAGDWKGALGHYHGELLAGLHVSGAAPFVDWVDRERERLREAAAGAAWKHAHALVAAGSPVEAERTGQRALHLVPTDESAVRGFIRALAAGGDRAAALRFYEKFATILAQELEVEPARETQAVAEAVRRGEVPVVHIPDTPPGGVTPPPSPSVTGTSEPICAEAAGGGPAETAQARSPWRRMLGIGGALAAVAAIAALGWVAYRSDPLAFIVTDVQPVTSESGVEWLAAISPDGGMVAYVAESHVEIRSTVSGGEGGGIRLEGQGLRSSTRPAWRGDGEFLRFLGYPEQGECAWMEIGRMGGAIRAVALPLGVPACNPSLAWSTDDAQVAFFRGDTLFVAFAEGGVRPLLALEPSLRRFGNLHSIAWSPDGKRIAFVNGSFAILWGMDLDASSIWVVEVESGRGWELVGGPAFHGSPVWMDDWRLLFVSDRDGARAVYVAEVGRPGDTGEPRALPHISDARTVSYSAATGRVAFSRLTAERIIRSYPAHPVAPVSIGDGVPVITGNRRIFGHDLSPDGEWIVYADDFRGQTDIYKAPLAGGVAVRLTDTPETESYPKWSPEGSEILFEAPGRGVDTDHYRLWTIPAGGGTPTQITAPPPDGSSHMLPAWLPDGRHVVFGRVPPGGGWLPDGLWVVEREAVGRPWGEPRRIAEGNGVVYTAVDETSVLVTHPGGRDGPMQRISLDGAVLWSRDVPATSALRTWARGFVARVSRDGGTIYSRGIHQDGTSGFWAIGEGGRGEPRLLIVHDRPELEPGWVSVGSDRIYHSVGTTKSDVWVAQLTR